MNLLILNHAAQLSLAELNSSARLDQRLSPAKLADGSEALNPDVLADCGFDQTWSHYAELLQTLPIEDRSDFAQPVNV